MSAQAQLKGKRKDYRALSASQITSKSRASRLQHLYSTLAVDDQDQYSPEFFLASVSLETWDPALIAIEDDDHLPIGILYTKQRKLFGFKTGLFFADATLGSLLLSDKRDQKEAFWAGMKTLLGFSCVRGLRLLVPPDGYEMALLRMLGIRQGFEFRTAPAESHLALPLTESYEQFLARLGSKTRRNFRYYRNRSDNAGHTYAQNLSLDEFSAEAWNLQSHQPTGGDATGLRRALCMFEAARKPLLVGLRSAEGELISLIGGWYESNRAVIFMQINSDQRHAQYSLSLVARTHLIETLIQQKYSQIIWWAGVGEPLNRYCVPVPSAWVYLDRPTLLWRTLRGLITNYRERLSASLQPIADWVVPPNGKDPSYMAPKAFRDTQ